MYTLRPRITYGPRMPHTLQFAPTCSMHASQYARHAQNMESPPPRTPFCPHATQLTGTAHSPHRSSSTSSTSFTSHDMQTPVVPKRALSHIVLPHSCRYPHRTPHSRHLHSSSLSLDWDSSVFIYLENDHPAHRPLFLGRTTYRTRGCGTCCRSDS